jgi:DegV family protein with EDD domain
MSKVAVITDSSPYIPADLVEQNQIHVIPLVLIWGEEIFNDGVDIVPEEFYRRLKTADVMPSTSQPTVAAFEELFTDLHNQGFDILAVLISEKLSGTVDSALQAQKAHPEMNIEIVDSTSTAMATGFQALAAARAALNGASLSECKLIAETAKERTGVIFLVDTLEFLHRGGRIGGAKRFMGTMLNIKPILAVQEGVVQSIGQVRTQKKALEELINIIVERTEGHSKIHLASLHANNYDLARDILEKASQRVSCVETVFSEVSPAIGTHAGPGALGLAYWIED